MDSTSKKATTSNTRPINKAKSSLSLNMRCDSSYFHMEPFHKKVVMMKLKMVQECMEQR